MSELRQLLRKAPDLVTAAGFIAVSVILTIGTGGLRPGPRALPRLMAASIAVCGVLLALQAIWRFRKLKRTEETSMQPESTAVEGAVRFSWLLPLAGLIVAYFFVSIIGFYVSFGLYVLVLHLHLSRPFNRAAVKKAFIFTILVMGVLYVFFRILLFVRTPTGFLV